MGRYCLFLILLLYMLFGIFGDLGVAGKEECSESTRCGYHEPAIRFPFYLKDRQPDHCGYPGFDLYCNDNDRTVLHLPSSANLSVQNIDYYSREIQVSASRYDYCFARQLLNLNLSKSASPFQFKSDHLLINYTFFICPSLDPYYCPDNLGYYVRVVPADSFIFDYFLEDCRRVSKMSSLPESINNAYGAVLQLNWSKKICGNCEARGQKCRRRKNSSNTEPEIECFDKPGSTARKMIAGTILGFFLLVIIIIALYEAYSFDKREKENQLKIEKFLENYIAFKPTRYSYDDIKRITNQFKDKLGQGGYGTVFKGKLSSEFLVAIKILHNVTGNGEEFINEVGTMSTIHHINVVRLVGFCAEGSKRALVYEFLPNESLEKFIFLTDGNKHILGWEKLQDIAIGIAKGIEYLHQGCDQRILHFDIKPHNILLDDNFNPKISDFGLAKLCSKEQSAISMTAARGTMGYIAPEVLSRNFGNVSYKSDVYSFGMVLLEMVGGRKNIDARVENRSQVYFPEWIYDRLDQGEELQIRIEEEGDADIAKKLTIIGLWCIQWYPADRPSMKAVLQMLEGDVDNLTTPPNPFNSAIQTNST